MKSKKIALIAYNHPESTLPLAKHFAKKDHHVDYFFVARWRSEGSSAFSFGRKFIMPGLRKGKRKFIHAIYDYLESDRVKIFFIVLPPSPLRYFFFASRLLFKMVGLHIKNANYDLINIVGQNPPLIDLYKSIGNNANLLSSLHEVSTHYNSQDFNYELIRYLFLSKIDIVTHSYASKNRLLKYSNACSDRIHVIPFGVFETYSLFKSSISLPSIHTPFILFYGNILPYKGIDVLYMASRLLKFSSHELKIVVAGRGKDPYLEKMKNDQRFIVLNRFISNEELVTLAKRSYCIVCPYKSASQSGIVPTAFLFGKPVIASNVGGFKEYITNGVNGLLVPPLSAMALADKISVLINNTDIYTRLSEGAKLFSTSPLFAWPNIADKYLSLNF